MNNINNKTKNTKNNTKKNKNTIKTNNNTNKTKNTKKNKNTIKTNNTNKTKNTKKNNKTNKTNKTNKNLLISNYIKKNGNVIIPTELLKKYLLITENMVKEYQSNKKKYFLLKKTLDFHKKRYKIYNKKIQNRLFNTLFKKNVDIITKNRVIEMLSNFIDVTDISSIYKMLELSNDTTIFDYIKNNYIKKNYIKKKNTSIFKIFEIASILEKTFLKYNNYNKNNPPKILDIGTGNGRKIKQIQKSMDIDSKIYGADIKEWGPYKKNRNLGFPFKYIQEKPYKIPYPDKSFDCILCLLTLHHIKNIDEALIEIKRILKNNGIVIIIEHDVWTDYDNIIIELQHIIYQKINNENINYSKYYSKYYNYYEWDILFDLINMKPIYGDRISEDITFHQRYDLQFIGVYKKN